MRIGVTGSRNYANRRKVQQVIRTLDLMAGYESEQWTLVHGNARGLDAICHDEFTRVLWNVEPHPADWRKHGRAAGPLRNQEMVDSGLDLLIAFPGGRGTEDMVNRAKAAGVLVLRIED